MGKPSLNGHLPVHYVANDQKVFMIIWLVVEPYPTEIHMSASIRMILCEKYGKVTSEYELK